ncbi:MAG: hypothetical protein AB7N80_01990 [Bdellovibrionales bacterium]
MKNIAKDLTNYMLFTIVAILLAALQSSLWLQLFGWFPAPQIWLAVLTFWVLYRELWEGVLMMYILATVVSAFTALPFAHLLVINLLTCLSLAFAKRRIYWAGSTFFMLANGAAVLCLFVFTMLVSWRYDRNPIRDLSFFSWLISVLLTMLVSLPLHSIFSWFDRLTSKEHPTEAGTGVL